MKESVKKIKQRKKWIDHYEQCQSVSLTCRKFDIPRSTFYRWYKRYQESGSDGLADLSRKPHNLAKTKVTKEHEQIILTLRSMYKWGPQRIATFLQREHALSFAKSTIWRILQKHAVEPVKKYRRSKKPKRYAKDIPGKRVQMDVTKVAPSRYQFTAIDDCTRLRVLKIYTRKTAENAVDFLHEVLDEFSFPIQAVQTDWGTEFFNDLFQKELMEHFIKFRPIKPRSPHLNGKVERSQQTDKIEFYSTIDKKNTDLFKAVKEWQEFYNKKRPHSSLNGKTPWEKYLELKPCIPIQPEVTTKYWESNEIIRPRSSKYFRFLEKQKIGN